MYTLLSGDVFVYLCAGLDDGEETASDPNSIQGGYLSFLQLRHLRIRDLQRTVRSAPPVVHVSTEDLLKLDLCCMLYVHPN